MVSAAPFPNSIESALLDRLTDSIARTCARADPEDVPVYEDLAYSQTGDFPLPVVAGLSCLTDYTRVYYWQAGRSIQAEEVFFQEVGERRIPTGICGEQTRAWQRWESGLRSGKLLCWSAANSFLWWTYDNDPILGIATRRNGDIYDLLDWWTVSGSLLQR